MKSLRGVGTNNKSGVFEKGKKGRKEEREHTGPANIIAYGCSVQVLQTPVARRDFIESKCRGKIFPKTP